MSGIARSAGRAPQDAEAKTRGSVTTAHPIRSMLVRRGLLGILTIVVIAIVVYFATIVLPGDAATAILGRDANASRLALVRHQLGLDQPLLSRFGEWAADAIRGDFGTSLTSGRSVADSMWPRIANSAVLVVVSATVSAVVGILLGMYAAFRRDGVFDKVGSVVGLVFGSMPEFVMAVFVAMLLAVNVFQLFPALSILPPGVNIWDQPSKLVLPALTLVLVTAPYVFRMMRGAMIEAMSSEYVEAARLRGVGGMRLAFGHAFPNALAPVVQVIGLNVLYLAGGIVLVENVFDFPGIGSALVEAIHGRDVPVIQFLVLMLAVVYVTFNILTDVLVLVVTPRRRYPR